MSACPLDRCRAESDVVAGSGQQHHHNRPRARTESDVVAGTGQQRHHNRRRPAPRATLVQGAPGRRPPPKATLLLGPASNATTIGQGPHRERRCCWVRAATPPQSAKAPADSDVVAGYGQQPHHNRRGPAPRATLVQAATGRRPPPRATLLLGPASNATTIGQGLRPERRCCWVQTTPTPQPAWLRTAVNQKPHDALLPRSAALPG